MRTFRGVVRTGNAHCLEAALSAAVILEQHGYQPLILGFESIDLLDHVLFIYKTRTGWGSIARSRDPGLHGRKPLFVSPRALALSYVEGYVDYTGRITGYEVFDLSSLEPYDWRLARGNVWLEPYDWRLARGNVWKVERLLLESPHRRIASSDKRIGALRRKYRAFRAVHDYKPWKYLKGRDRWTPLPPEYRRRG